MARSALAVITGIVVLAGACSSDDDAGVASGAQEPGCDQGTCVPDAQSCAASQACRTSGYCGLRDGRCAVTEEGCASSTACETRGECYVDGSICVALPQGAAGSAGSTGAGQ